VYNLLGNIERPRGKVLEKWIEIDPELSLEKNILYFHRRTILFRFTSSLPSHLRFNFNPNANANANANATPSRKGMKHSSVIKAKISKARTGKLISDEAKAKAKAVISAATAGANNTRATGVVIKNI
jgi:hypothetical protein